LSSTSTENRESRLTFDEIGRFVMLPHTFIHDAKRRKLRFHARWLFVALMYYRNGKTGSAFPSYDTLRELTGLSRNMISKCLKELESAGWISLKRRFNATTIYTLNFPALGEKYEEAHERKYEDRYEGKYENERSDTEEYLDGDFHLWWVKLLIRQGQYQLNLQHHPVP
jgi:DNA-binding MarR family transcriptional regulator